MMLGITGLLTIFVGVLFLLFYFYQERVIFIPQKLPKDHQFNYNMNYEERFVDLEDRIRLHALLFRTNSTKGVVLYLHGNAGSLDQWGYVAPPFLNAGYDVFIIDYRGFGKSEGVISSEKELYEDMQSVYNYLKKEYQENEIILAGFSLGTGLATKLAAQNNPKLLILKAPYYSMVNVKNHHFPYLPTFLLRYPLHTYKFIDQINCPLIIFHGEQDEIVPFESSLQLKELTSERTKLFPLKGQKHNGISIHPEYIEKLDEVLNKKQ
ncbi:MAG: alpha/beta hydrolase [Marinifilaceae bacterium]